MNNFNHCGGGFPAFGNHHDKPFDGEQKGLGKIFYKSDFSVWLADPTGDKTTPFTLTFYVGDLESTYTAGFDGLDYKRCKRNEDGSLLVFFDHHALPCGRLMLRVEVDKVNPDYGDGEQNTADKLPLPIILWDGATSYEPTMAYALAPYIVGKDGEKGEDGKPFTYDDLTEEEKKDLGEKATAELAETAQRSYTAEDDAAMEIIKDPKEGDICTCLTAREINASSVHAGDVITKIKSIDDAAKVANFNSYLAAKGGTAYGFWLDDFDSNIIMFDLSSGAYYFGGGSLLPLDFDFTYRVQKVIDEFNALPEAQRTVKRVGYIDSRPIDLYRIGGESPIIVEVRRVVAYTYHNGEWVMAVTEKEVSEMIAEAESGKTDGKGYTELPAWLNDLEDNTFYTGAEIEARGGDLESLKKLIEEKSIYKSSEKENEVERCVFYTGYSKMPNYDGVRYYLYGVYAIESAPNDKPVYITAVMYVSSNGGFSISRSVYYIADGNKTPAILTAKNAATMEAITTAKDGDRCIVGGNAIYDRVGGTWYFTAGVQPARTVKASELKAGDKIKAVNFDTSKTPAGTGDGIFCTIGGVPIEMMAFIDSLSYGTGKTPLFTGTWNTANTAACSAAMAGKTVDSVAASMAALSANVDDWLSFEIE